VPGTGVPLTLENDVFYSRCAAKFPQSGNHRQLVCGPGTKILVTVPLSQRLWLVARSDSWPDDVQLGCIL